ncbi:DUF2066 domain-containing protein [Pseudidiomarina sp.]|uniref:DUF2066 domain-containing protein n=1 Tax=Pseudidiomarina sp. TaxID=2081707 RepID=UPI00299F33E2|nr:DUF2066 domain-containing protein [Pseudidiomarina sp.]MDX1705701.1 DUF2066 domain-containing protein [Pseudidiomarina sp.]
MRFVLLCCGWLTLALIASPAHAAVELQQLYQSSVAVSSQAANERNQALQAALRQALLKISGDDSLFEQPSVQQALRSVRDYVVQYGYRQEDELLLWAQFDREKVNQLIQQAGSGIWSNLRPEILIWLAIEDESLQRQLIASGDETVFVQQLRNAAASRGLPIKLPLLDLNDNMSISVLDVWGRFEHQLEFASIRYSPDGMVIARVFQADSAVTTDRWMLDWTLQLGELRWRGEVTGMDRSGLGAKLIADLSTRLAKRYRIGAEVEKISSWRIQVYDLADLIQVIRAEQLLSSLPSVNSVQLVTFGRNRAEFELSLKAEPARIMQAIDLSKQMRPISAPENSTAEKHTPSYRWVQSE